MADLPNVPRLAEQAAREMAAIYSEAEERLLALLARRVAAGHSTGYDVWARAKRSEALLLRRAAEAIAAGHRSRVETALGRIARAAVGDFKVVGTPDAVRAVVEATGGLLRRADARILRATADAYREIQAAVAAQMTTGSMTLLQAIQTAVDRFAARGISGFVDSAGRSWGIQEYAEMATRTAVARAHVEARRTEFEGTGRRYVIISDSPEECPLCRPWEGRICGVSGPETLPDGTSVPSLDSAIAAGLLHPNCTHTIGAWIPGLSRPMRETENPEGYKQRQKQRYYERNVRAWKRREAACVDPARLPYLRARRRAAVARHDDYVESLGRIPQRGRLTPVRPRSGGGPLPAAPRLPDVPSPPTVPSPWCGRTVLRHGDPVEQAIRGLDPANADVYVRAYRRIRGILGDDRLLLESADGTLPALALDHLAYLNRLPDDLLRQIDRIHIGEGAMTDLDLSSALRGVTPRGWEGSGRTWDSVPGGHRTGTVLAGTKGGHGCGSLILHESGHAIDFRVGLGGLKGAGTETGRAVWDLYQEAKATGWLPDYLLQRGAAGLQEFIASSVDLLYSGRDELWFPPSIRRRFEEILLAAARATA